MCNVTKGDDCHYNFTSPLILFLFYFCILIMTVPSDLLQSFTALYELNKETFQSYIRLYVLRESQAATVNARFFILQLSTYFVFYNHLRTFTNPGLGAI
jgi:hypothetical protein